MASKLKLNYDLQKFKGDILGGITATVVGLPLSLAFGIASGLGAIAGLYGAVAVGFFSAAFGGTKLQISAITGPMTIAMAVIVTNHANSLAEAFTIVALAGLIQILLGVAKLGTIVAYTPYSVISGFMSGIGMIIILVHTLPFVGVPVVPGSPFNTIAAWPETIKNINHHAVAIATVTLAIGVLWPAKLKKYVPSIIAALIVGTGLGVFWLDEAPVIGEVQAGLPKLWLPVLSLDLFFRAIEPAFILALIASINSLLTSMVADSLTRTQHDSNRELIGQGLGNTVAGLIGGVPGAATPLATVANIKSGGQTRVAGVLWSLILLTILLGLGKFISVIPNAVLAAIMMIVGFNTIDWRFISRIHRVQKAHMVVMLLTFGTSVFVDLLTAVAIGLISAGIATSRQLEGLEADSVVSTPLLDHTFLEEIKDKAKLEEIDLFSAQTGLISLRGAFTVASSRKLTSTINADIRDNKIVILDFSKTLFVDDSAALVVERMIDIASGQDTECIVMGLSGLPKETLNGLNVFKNVPEENFADDIDEAREIAKKLLAK